VDLARTVSEDAKSNASEDVGSGKYSMSVGSSGGTLAFVHGPLVQTFAVWKVKGAMPISVADSSAAIEEYAEYI
jgi:hypothetical protein